MIDMHAHWRPAEVTDALRVRTKEPRIVRNQDGVEVLKSRMVDGSPWGSHMKRAARVVTMRSGQLRKEVIP